ncbi:MAG: sulfite reductase, ferredoxin dependent [Pseudanabaenaceae cyanobacterium]
MTDTVRRSREEGIKERSQFLKGTLPMEVNEPTPAFSRDAMQILKFHGTYQQRDRDHKGDAPYSMMLRTRTPAGVVAPELYLTLDTLADRFANGTLRVTDRQGFQLHGVLKSDLKTVIREIVHHMGSTLGACGDVNRNVMCPPPPFKNAAAYNYARTYARNIADLLRPQTSSYYEIWLDGEKFVTAEAPEVTAARNQPGRGRVNTNIPDCPEPIYGVHYMPRKFKTALTVPGDNSVDLFTNDLGLVVIVDEQDQLRGFNVYVGGGLGRTHRDEQTIVRLADGIGFVPADRVYEVVKAVVALQRDHGDRLNRKHARLKYLLHDWGVEKFKQVLKDYYPDDLEPLVELPPFTYQDYLGWHEQGDGNKFLGIAIENGRIADRNGWQLKTALREITERFQLTMHLTPQQNVLLCDVSPDIEREVQRILTERGVLMPEAIDPIVRQSMACPALPTCGLAVTESERVLPSVLRRIRALLEKLNLGQESFVVRMTGCPNGCARPYMAELGFVGSGIGEYQVWLGGTLNSTRLAEPFIDRMPLDKLEATLEPLFVCFREERQPGELFGDFCARKGIAYLQEFAQHYVPPKTKDMRHRVTLSPPVYERLKEAARTTNRSMKELVEAALKEYLSKLTN